MPGFLIKSGVVTLFSALVIYFYYFIFQFHNESFSGGYALYITLLIIGYSIYKFFYVQFSDDKYRFSPLILISLFLSHLLIFCICFFSLNNLPLGYSIILLFNILFHSVLPLLIFFISHSFGEKLLSYIKGFRDENNTFRTIASTGLGFTLIVTFLTITSFIGQFNVVFFLLILLSISIFSYKNLLQNFSDLISTRWEVQGHDFSSRNWFKIVQPYLITSEFLFIVITALISVNLINIVRPFPIGWDDLGVYMNYANIIGSSGQMALFGQMSTWQVFTGIGFIFGSSSQAFFLNSFSGIIATLTIIFSIKSFFKNDDENKHSLISFITHTGELKHFLNIPLLMGAIYISLPMVIFHLAKDMKLDQGLLFISIFCIFIIFYTLNSLEKRSKKNNLIYILLAGIIAGFAFSIKLTTLLLISSIIGLLWFVPTGIIGFIGYISLFLALFTKFHLWDLLNVVYPKDDPVFINLASGIMAVIGILCIIWATKMRGILSIKTGALYVTSFIVGILIGLSPWIVWNTTTSDNLSLMSIINGKSEGYTANFELIREKEFIEKKLQESTMTESGKSLNEDLGRYFGYENGINNYLKIFWNVSMQVNQKGEFTEISYIFFALIPSLFLFLPFRRKIYNYILYSILILFVLFFMIKITNTIGTSILSNITLPYGYLFVIIPYAGLIWLTLSGLDSTKSKLLKVFIFNIITMSFYTFLWAISAFGIVWYGIAMYFFFLLAIAICLYFVSAYNGDENTMQNRIKAIVSYLLFGIISIYFIFSSYPHLFTNLQAAGFPQFKIGAINEKESIFESHQEYIDFLFELNIDNKKKEEFLETYKKEFIQAIKASTYATSELVSIIENTKNVRVFENILSNVSSSTEISDIQLKNQAKRVKNNLYKGLIYPQERFRSHAIIYRLGTFMKYFIVDNHKRLYEDSLVTGFNDYLYDEDFSKITERFKKLGMEQILLDLNAATIDNDPRKDLTKRYEKMLSYLTSDDLEYISGDSICFSLALDIYKKSKREPKDLEQYILLAGSNHDSILPDGTVATRNAKITNCFYTIKDLITNNKVDSNSPQTLQSIYSFVKNPANNIKTDEDWINTIGKNMTPGAKVLFRIK